MKRNIVIYLIILLNLIFAPSSSIQVAIASNQFDLNSARELKKQDIAKSDVLTAKSESRNSGKLDIIKKTPIISNTQEKELFAKKIEAENIKQKELPYIHGEVLIKFKSKKINLQQPVGKEKVKKFIIDKNLEKKEDIEKNNTSIFRTKKDESVESVIERLKDDPNVEYIEPNYKLYPSAIDSNDTYKGLLWGLDNIGQKVNSASGSVDADIDAPEAWEVSGGVENEIIVAVIDDGVAYNHPDLKENMWDGSNCKDEIGNYLGSCSHGYDYEDNDKIPLPSDNYHGTHVAGTIAALKNNSRGIIGVAPKAKIMAIKFGLTISSEIKAIDFAIQNGVKIINASYGGPSFSIFEYDAIERFRDSGGIFVAAASNSGINSDNGTFTYPADYNLDNIISVAATDQNDNLAYFSNYGAISVDVGAPGTNIYSTVTDFSTILFEPFDDLTPPNIPDGWIKTGDWGTVDMTASWGSAWGNVLIGDINYPYLANTNSIITSPYYDLGKTAKADINFYTKCDTSYHLYSEGSIFQDYMVLEVSPDGENFSELKKWNEFLLDVENHDGENSSGWASKYYSLTIPDSYLTSNFKFRLRWVTDEIDNNYLGCLIDGVIITGFSDGSLEQYGYMQGTSMAAPHVAGLAALIWGYKPELDSTKVRDIILTTGDDLLSLAGKTVTGKRINAFKALNSLTGLTISGTVKYYDGLKPIPDATVILENSNGNQLAAALTNALGFYEFTEVSSGGDYIVRVEKDDNSAFNGVSVSDLIKIRKHLVESEIFNQLFKVIAADVNNSGSVSVADLVKIRRYIAEIDILLPKGWKFYSSEALLTEENYLTEGLGKTYFNLTTDLNNQNFIGIKMGDVNNSWNSD
ncbi:MAG: S8 family serine peptidase [Patescibacteria group bacterium]